MATTRRGDVGLLLFETTFREEIECSVLTFAKRSNLLSAQRKNMRSRREREQTSNKCTFSVKSGLRVTRRR